MSEQKEEKPSTNFMWIILLLFAFLMLVFLFGETGWASQSYESSTMMFLGLIGVLLLFTVFFRLLTRTSTTPQKITLTVLKCTKCAFQSIRNFQVGDYIPKVVGKCPSCGGPFQVEAIYVEEKAPKKKPYGIF